MDKLKMQTQNLADENYAVLASMFPNAVTETIDENGVVIRAIDADVLKQEINVHVISNKEERYQFTWPDKKKAMLLANAPIAATFRPCREESVNFDTTENLYVEGDNLDVLKLLRETYLNRVKMIYIDPPYNTGNDFVYEDDFSVESGEFLRRDGQYDNQGNRLTPNLDSNGRFHTDWLNMIYPRLRVARDLLCEDGLLFISIDENEINNLRKSCDEVFGETQFVAQITLLCNPKGRSQDKYIANCHEYILIYSKSILQAGSVSIPKSDAEISTDYPLIDSNGRSYRELELRNTHRDFGKFNRPKLWYPIYISADGSVTLQHKAGSVEVYPFWDDGFEGCWTWGKEKALNEIHLLIGKKVLGKWKIYRKAYAFMDDQAPLKQVKSIWNDNMFFTEKGQNIVNSLFDTRGKLFQAPKSIDMIKQCIQMSQKEDALILDFFSGSATTAHAVMQQNAEDGGKRKFIMVQLPEICPIDSEAALAGYETICEIGKERIRRAGKKIKESNPLGTRNLDTGFRVLKLDSSNMKDVYYTPEKYAQMKFDLEGFADNIKLDRTDEDLLFQVMLDLGIPLSARISQNSRIFSVNDNYLIACFGKVDTTLITEIAKQEPYYAVFRDSGFQNDSALVNFEQIFSTFSPKTIRRVL